MPFNVPPHTNIIYRAFDLYSASVSPNYHNSYVLARMGNDQFGYFPTEQFALTSSNTFIGNQTITGSLNISGSFTSSLQNGYFWVGDNTNTTKLQSTSSFVSTASFNAYTASLSYGSFSDTTTQSGSVNTAIAIKHNTTDIASGISVVSGSRITVSQTGVYEIITSQQYTKNNAGTDEITVWLSYTGSNVANSATDLMLKGSGARDLFVCNYMLQMQSGSYFEVYWSSTTNDTTILTIGERSNPTRPAVPSVITTVKKIG